MAIDIEKKRTTLYLGNSEIDYLKKVSLAQDKSVSEYIRNLVKRDMGKKDKYSLKDLRSLVFREDKHPGKTDEVLYE